MIIQTSSSPVSQGNSLETFQTIQNRTPVEINPDLCTGCELCTYACPQSVLKTIPDVHRVEGLVAVVYNPSLCTACRQCEDVCPDFCITVDEER